MVYYDSTVRRSFSSNETLHQILETRCLPITMPNRPGNYENPRPELALELKERLTAWRAKHLCTTFTDMAPIEGIAGRLWDYSKDDAFCELAAAVDPRILQNQSSLLPVKRKNPGKTLSKVAWLPLSKR
jgi:hypothetical protein